MDKTKIKTTSPQKSPRLASSVSRKNHIAPDPIVVTDDLKHDAPDATTNANEEVIQGEHTQENTTEEEFPNDIDVSIEKLSEEVDTFLSSIKDQKSENATEIPIGIKRFTEHVEQQIEKYVPGDDVSSENDSVSLLESICRVSKLTAALGEFHSNSTCVTLINRTSTILQRAMSLLENEFRSLLEDKRIASGDSELKPKQAFFNDKDRCVLPNSDVIEENNSDNSTNFPGYSPDIVLKLREIATTMISSGYETECCQVYTVTRRNTFEESLSSLGFEKISIDDVQKMQWEPLEGAITTWIKVIKRCTGVLFSGEKKLSEDVFPNNLMISGTLFSNLMRGVIIQLLNFIEAVAMTKRSAEKLFKYLDMYESLRELIPALDGLVQDESWEELKSEMLSARCRLGESIVGIFCELENSIKSDIGKTPVPGGAVHPLTRYTMNYVKYACEYKETLEHVFQEHQKIDQSDASSGPETDINNQMVATPSPFSVQLMKVMDLLDSNLETKSKLYKDLSLSYIFKMNNGRYIMQKIKGSLEIHDLMGDTWCRKRSSDLRQYHKNYQRETWGKVLGCLRDEGLQVNGKVLKPVLKERFKSFNAMFDEIHKAQSSWIVSDEQLQSELRVSISAVVIPAYRSFLGRFRQYLDSGRQSEKYIKFGPEDIETYIDELFDGNPASSIVRRRT